MRAVKLRELLVVEIQVRAPVDLGGGRRFIPFDGGSFEGYGGLEGTAGTVLEGGIDWQNVRSDGVLDIDAHYTLRVLAGCIRRHHDDIDLALRHYELARRPATAAIVRANRGLGPELPMKLVEERAPDGFADIADVITLQEIAEATEEYRRTAGSSLKRGQSLLNDPY